MTEEQTYIPYKNDWVILKIEITGKWHLVGTQPINHLGSFITFEGTKRFADDYDKFLSGEISESPKLEDYDGEEDIFKNK